MVRRSRRWRGHRDDQEQLEFVEFQPGTTYKFYYTQDETDQGVIMETNLPTKDVSKIFQKINYERNVARSFSCMKKLYKTFPCNVNF